MGASRHHSVSEAIDNIRALRKGNVLGELNIKDLVEEDCKYCAQYGLTVYDGAYLELAKRKGFALATLDAALLKAAPLAGVALVPQP